MEVEDSQRRTLEGRTIVIIKLINAMETLKAIRLTVMKKMNYAIIAPLYGEKR